ncbi:collagen alpha-1(I) chain-like [Meles meles]|uniref:collagen alpha-1(I) chain-like n=1 Tax=Meles meles TaxID=9662 RepID=UPI001E69DD58|nr:collagen alpha-1(I) chain-like [Meles meles]
MKAGSPWAIRGRETRGAPAPHRLQDRPGCPRLHAAKLPRAQRGGTTASYGSSRKPGRFRRASEARRPRAERSPSPGAVLRGRGRLGRTGQAGAAEPRSFRGGRRAKQPSDQGPRPKQPPPRKETPQTQTDDEVHRDGDPGLAGSTSHASALRPRREQSPTWTRLRHAPAPRVDTESSRSPSQPRGGRAPGRGRSFPSARPSPTAGARGDTEGSGVLTPKTPGPRGTSSVAGGRVGCGRGSPGSGPARTPSAEPLRSRNAPHPVAPRAEKRGGGQAGAGVPGRVRAPTSASGHRNAASPHFADDADQTLAAPTRHDGADRRNPQGKRRKGLPDAPAALESEADFLKISLIQPQRPRLGEQLPAEEAGDPRRDRRQTLNPRARPDAASRKRGAGPVRANSEQLPVSSAETCGSCPRPADSRAERGRARGPRGPGALQRWGRGRSRKRATRDADDRVRARRDDGDGKRELDGVSPRSPGPAQSRGGRASPTRASRDPDPRGSSWKRAGGGARLGSQAPRGGGPRSPRRPGPAPAQPRPPPGRGPSTFAARGVSSTGAAVRKTRLGRDPPGPARASCQPGGPGAGARAGGPRGAGRPRRGGPRGRGERPGRGPGPTGGRARTPEAAPGPARTASRPDPRRRARTAGPGARAPAEAQPAPPPAAHSPWARGSGRRGSRPPADDGRRGRALPFISRGFVCPRLPLPPPPPPAARDAAGRCAPPRAPRGAGRGRGRGQQGGPHQGPRRGGRGESRPTAQARPPSLGWAGPTTQARCRLRAGPTAQAQSSRVGPSPGLGRARAAAQAQSPRAGRAWGPGGPTAQAQSRRAGSAPPPGSAGGGWARGSSPGPAAAASVSRFHCAQPARPRGLGATGRRAHLLRARAEVPAGPTAGGARSALTGGRASVLRGPALRGPRCSVLLRLSPSSKTIRCFAGGRAPGPRGLELKPVTPGGDTLRRWPRPEGWGGLGACGGGQPRGRDFRGLRGHVRAQVDRGGSRLRVCVRFALARRSRVPARPGAERGGGGLAWSSGDSVDAVAAGQGQPATCLWLFPVAKRLWTPALGGNGFLPGPVYMLRLLPTDTFGGSLCPSEPELSQLCRQAASPSPVQVWAQTSHSGRCLRDSAAPLTPASRPPRSRTWTGPASPTLRESRAFPGSPLMHPHPVREASASRGGRMG